MYVFIFKKNYLYNNYIKFNYTHMYVCVCALVCMYMHKYVCMHIKQTSSTTAHLHDESLFSPNVIFI